MLVNDVVTTTLGRKALIAPHANKAMRRNGASGVVIGVLGKRDQYILVLHEGESTPAVYLPEELRIEPNAYWKLTYTQQGLSYFIEIATYDEVRELLDSLEDDGAKDVLIEGPFYSDKELTDGLLPTRSLFDRIRD